MNLQAGMSEMTKKVYFVSSLFSKPRNQLFHFELLLSLTVSLALFCVIIFASISGTFFPLMLDKLKIDPALATGPFVTTANDIVGLIIYFSVGHYFLTHFASLPYSLF